MSGLTTTGSMGHPTSEDANADSWRVEVAARLERYRTRRKPRAPRYPSLLLPFDASENWSRPAPATRSMEVAAAAAREDDLSSHVRQDSEEESGPSATEPRPALEQALQYADSPAGLEPFTNVIEFPRSAAIPVSHPSDLADPVLDFDRPRIVEAPEIVPPPPSLGGMLIEPTPAESADQRAAGELVVASASIGRRALAALVDGAVIGTALAGFGTIFVRLNPSLNPILKSVCGPLPVLAAALGVVAVLLWAVYEFIFVVYTGSTPGLRAAGLRLAAFDGAALDRRRRRWRVLASFLSAFSAGLGYLWCALDQDGLCWHDRITRTCVQPKNHPK